MKKAIFFTASCGIDKENEFESCRGEGRISINTAFGFSLLGYECYIVNDYKTIETPKKIWENVYLINKPDENEIYDIVFSWDIEHLKNKKNYKYKILSSYADTSKLSKIIREQDLDIILTSNIPCQMHDPTHINYKITQYLPTIFPIPSINEKNNIGFLPYKFEPNLPELKVLLCHSSWEDTITRSQYYTHKQQLILNTLNQRYKVNLYILVANEKTARKCPLTYDLFKCNEVHYIINEKIRYDDIIKLILDVDLCLSTGAIFMPGPLIGDIISLGKPMIYILEGYPSKTEFNNNCLCKCEEYIIMSPETDVISIKKIETALDNLEISFNCYRKTIEDYDFKNWKKYTENFLIKNCGYNNKNNNNNNTKIEGEQNMIQHIIDNIYISNWKDAKHAHEVGEFNEIFTVAIDSPFIGNHYYGLVNGLCPENEKLLTGAVNDLLETKSDNYSKKILVHCVSGFSRSAAVVIGYMIKKGYTVEDALDYIKKIRPLANPVPELIKLLKDNKIDNIINKFGDRISWEHHVDEIVDTKNIHEIFYGPNNEKINKLKKYKQSGKVLDCGCHIGRWIEVFRENDYDYTGVDQSYKALETARKYKPDGKFIYSLLWNMSFNNEFDIVHFNAVLQHNLLSEQEKILPRVHQALKSDGILIISESTVTKETRTQRTYQGWITFIEKHGFKFMESWHKNELGLEDNYLFLKTEKSSQILQSSKNNKNNKSNKNNNITKEDLTQLLKHKTSKEEKYMETIPEIIVPTTPQVNINIANTDTNNINNSLSNNTIYISEYWNSEDDTIPFLERIKLWRQLKIEEEGYFISLFILDGDKVVKISKLFEKCGFKFIDTKIDNANNDNNVEVKIIFKKVSISKIKNWEYLRQIHTLMDSMK